jgi:hypothetical protein
MTPDIAQTPLFRKLPAQIDKVARTKDRFDAALFFIQTASTVSSEDEATHPHRRRQATYCYSAALTNLCSTEDSFNLDAEDLGLADQWQASRERDSFRTEPLIGVLRELRNYTVHFQFLEHHRRPFFAEWGGEVRDLGEPTYLAPIEWCELSRLRNFQEERTSVTEETLDWFNRQVAIWPAGFLLAEASSRYAEVYTAFLSS